MVFFYNDATIWRMNRPWCAVACWVAVSDCIDGSRRALAPNAAAVSCAKLSAADCRLGAAFYSAPLAPAVFPCCPVVLPCRSGSSPASASLVQPRRGSRSGRYVPASCAPAGIHRCEPSCIQALRFHARLPPLWRGMAATHSSEAGQTCVQASIWTVSRQSAPGGGIMT